MKKGLAKINFQFRALYGVVLLFLILPFIVNCGANPATALLPEEPAFAAETGHGDAEELPLAVAAFNAGSDTLWADASGTVPSEGISSGSPSSRISLDVRDANILDVLSILAIKMGTQIIYLEEPVNVTFKSSNLAALTTFQLLLQKEQLDYLVVAGHYVVGNRDRLYDDFYNRMILTHYNTTYISVQTLQELIRELHIPVENVTVDVNTQEIWVQGTPMALGKFVELLNEVDRRENAAFNTGGERIIRMPVSFAQGSVEELDALAELLDHLLEKGKTAHGHVDWVKTFCSNDPPYDVEIEPGQLKLEVKEIGPNTWFLIAEGTPDDIDIVRKMIEEIRSSMGTLPFSFTSGSSGTLPFSYTPGEASNENGNGNSNGNGNGNGNENVNEEEN